MPSQQNCRFANPDIVPFNRSVSPRSANSRERLRRGRIQIEHGLGVRLEKTRGDRRSNFAFDRLGHDWRLVFAKGNQDDLAGIENGSNTHGDGATGDVFFAKKITGRVHPCHPIQRDQSRAARFARTRFIKTDVSGSTNPE